jgi:adenylate kinase|tara:strand:- start:173 stop:742 length:570 start_codon:yes stop_codon:yes gene_type:complete
MNILLFGPPGAGKGTQAKLICKKFSLDHVSTGDILRNEISKGSKLGVTAKQIIDSGHLVSDEIIIDIIKIRLSEIKMNNASFLLDGFPRSINQANLLSSIMKELDIKLNAAILIDVEQPVLINRIINRKNTEGREDDSEEVLASRLKVYYDQTAPLIQFYKDLNLLKWVNGVGEISDINQQINSIMEQL